MSTKPHKYTTFNATNNDAVKEPMFFGQPVNVARYDQQKYPIFEKLIDTQMSFFWRPEEIDVSKDRIDFANLPDNEKHIFLSNLKYQILLDSVQGRSPNVAFLPIVSIPELETWIEVWAFSETIHSRSYTHIIRNIVVDPSEVFDEIVPNPHIAERAKAVTKHYDDLIDATGLYQRSEISLREMKKKLILCMVSVNVLEAIRFYVSFACSFAFAERKIMEGNAKIIRLIARDEALHMAGTQNILNIWRRSQEGSEYAELMEKLKPEIRAIFLDAAIQEKEWTSYLFKDGSMIGLNKKILDQYVEHLTDKRLRAVGLEAEFGDAKNPIPWINDWLHSDAVQVAPQEVSLTSYLSGALDSTVNEGDFDDFSL